MRSTLLALTRTCCALRLPADLTQPTLYIRDQKSAHRVYVDGKLVASSGTVGRDATSTLPFYLPQIVELPVGESSAGANGERTLVLAIQVANFHDRNGGLFFPLRFGSEGQIRKWREARLVLDIFMLGTLSIFGLYHLGLFAMRPRERTTLFFGAICLDVALRMLLTGERYFMQIFPGWSLRNPVPNRVLHVLRRDPALRDLRGRAFSGSILAQGSARDSDTRRPGVPESAGITHRTP